MVTTRDNWPWLHKKQKNCPKWNHLLSLNYAITIPLGISTLKPQKPNLSHLCHVPKGGDTFHSISQRGWQMILIIISQVRNATTLDAKNSADYIYWRPLPISPCKRSWHLTQDSKRRPTSLSYRICSNTIFFQPVSSLSKYDEWVLHSLLCFQS